MEDAQRVRMVLATPLPEELCRHFEELAPGVDLVRDHGLLPPMRHPGDHDGDPAWVRTPEDQVRFDALVDSADALYGIPDVSSSALARTVRANPRLRWVQTMAAGGAAQVSAANLSDDDLERICVTTSAGVHAGTLAEFAVFGLLAGAKHLPRLIAQQSQHEWSPRWAMGQVHEQRVLIVGLGSIGRKTAELLLALGAHVIGVNRRDIEVPGVDRVFKPADIVVAAEGVDAIVVTLPGAAATTWLVDARVFSAARPGVTVASVGRGTVINEPDLVEALRQGVVGFAALDVTAVEPLPSDSPLWDMPNVVISPHTAALSPQEDRRIVELAAANARLFVEGLTLRNVVAPADLS